MSSYRRKSTFNPIKYILITLALALVVTVGYFSRTPSVPTLSTSSAQTINIPASALTTKKTTNISVPIDKNTPAKVQ